jgi:hypothetical protein
VAGRRFVSGRWPGGRVCRGLQAAAGRRCASALGRRGAGRAAAAGGRRAASGGPRAACGCGLWRVWGTGGIGRNRGMRLRLGSECWAGPKMNVGLKYFVG